MRYTPLMVMRLAVEAGVALMTAKRWLAHKRVHPGNDALITAAAERLGYKRPERPEEKTE
jgi:DNA-binding LacI/PurR family transcriptional regulator